MKTGDNEKFIAISKAYKTLTDPNLLKKFYDTGDPNGIQTVIFNIALPSILSDDKYSTWILLIYGFCFLILLPTGVVIWWYKSIKYGNNQVFFLSKSYFLIVKNYDLITFLCNVNESDLLLSCNYGIFDF